MGAEDFRVYLTTPRPVDDAVSLISSLPFVKRARVALALPGEHHFTREDPAHILEIEAAPTQTGTTVSVRFALCHPPSVDRVFGQFVTELAAQLGADVTIAEDVEADDPGLGWSFRQPELASAMDAVLQRIPKKRRNTSP